MPVLTEPSDCYMVSGVQMRNTFKESEFQTEKKVGNREQVELCSHVEGQRPL